MPPGDTLAIIVGIEKYDINDRWNLNGPALDAARFTRWLRSRDVPADNIRLFAAPLDENKAQLDSLPVACHKPDYNSISSLLRSPFVKRPGDLLFLFWGGHGVMGEGSRRLFFSNASENFLATLSVEKLLEFLRSDLVPNVARIVVLVDACANYFELQQSPAWLKDMPLDGPGLPRAAVSQFVLFAASPGERASNLGVQRTGLFSSLLMDELEKSPPDWPPDFSAVKRRLDAQFLQLRKDGKASQTPAWFSIRDWAGEEQVEYSLNQKDLGPDDEDLVEALSGCPTLQDLSGRTMILGELLAYGVQSVRSILPLSDKRKHLRAMVSVLVKDGSRSALIARVLEREIPGASRDTLRRVQLEIEQQLFSRDTCVRLRQLLGRPTAEERQVLRIFQECARGLNPRSSEDGSDLYLLLMTLAGFPRQNDGFPLPALLFAEKAASLIPPAIAGELRTIVTQVAAQRGISGDIEDFRSGSKWASANGTATLVLALRSKAGGLALRASLLNDDGRWTPLATDDAPVAEKAAREKFRDLVVEAEQSSSRLVIEMAVAREMLCWPLERWEIDVGGFNAAVGVHYPVVLRWLERLRDQRFRPRWSAKWQAAKNYQGAPLWLRSTSQFRPTQLLAMLDQAPDAGIFVSFAFPPSSAAEKQGDALSVALSGGTPVAVWWRECDPNPDVAQAELQALLTQQQLGDLPNLLRTLRNQAEQQQDPKHPGYRIALLFDNHDHQPPLLPGL